MSGSRSPDAAKRNPGSAQNAFPDYAEPFIGRAFARSIGCRPRTDCLTGKSVNPVQPPLQKYFCSRLTQITSISPAVPPHSRGVSRSSRTRVGMRWTRQRLARAGIAGRVEPRERTKRVRTTDVIRGRQSRVVLAPVAGAKFAEASRPDRVDKTLIR